MPTSNSHFLVEVDGVTVCEATEVDQGGTKHEPFKVWVGNRPNPELGRNKYEVDEIKIKHAIALGAAGSEFAREFFDYVRGLNTAKFNCRVITLAEDGFTPLAIDEYIGCVPTSFEPESKKADSKDAAYFSCAFKPSDHVPIY